MRFSGEAERFMRPGGDRLVALGSILSGFGLRYSVVKLDEGRHLLLRVGKAAPALVLVAHYDRAPGSAGALDNSCACLQLASLAARLSSRRAEERREGGPGPSLLIAFTDAEEAPGSGLASSQGSFALARALAGKASAPGAAEEGLAALVLDVTGRGGRLLYSTAPSALLARNGLEGKPVAAGYRALVAFASKAAARAGLAPPLGAELPWSDDLGLTLGGLPALALSLLPEAELPLLAAGKKPPTWRVLHTADDRPELAEEGAFDTMAAFLDAVADCLREAKGSPALGPARRDGPRACPKPPNSL
jgi:Zn-dependent M28 family amino/carboxypeptidase